MSRIGELIEAGHLMPTRPRGLADAEHAYFPLKKGVRYRTFWNPQKGHLAQGDTDHSFCGIGLCPPEDPDFMIYSGWDEVAWFIVDTRESSTWCKPCSDGWNKEQSVSGPNRTLPADSPVSAEEWAKKHEQLSALENRKWAALIARINDVLPVEDVTGQEQM